MIRIIPLLCIMRNLITDAVIGDTRISLVLRNGVCLERRWRPKVEMQKSKEDNQ